MGKSIIIANGSLWNTEAYHDIYIIDLDSNSIEHKYDLDWNTYAESSVYYKNSLWVFGGGDAESDGAIRKSRSTNRFYKINFLDMPCSIGTFKQDNECIPCAKGTYKDTDGD